MVKARPIENEDGKWNIECECEDGEKLLLGRRIDDIFMEYLNFDTKEDAIESIKNDVRMELVEE